VFRSRRGCRSSQVRWQSDWPGRRSRLRLPEASGRRCRRFSGSGCR
jgi:hypothetical protein